MNIEQISGAGMQSNIGQFSSNAPVNNAQSENIVVNIGQKKVATIDNKLSDEDVKTKVEELNKELRHSNTNLRFDYHEKLKQVMVKIVDNDTSKVIKEIPSKKILDMVAAMMEKAGLIIDKKG